jgi:hypothetical protein
LHVLRVGIRNDIGILVDDPLSIFPCEVGETVTRSTANRCSSRPLMGTALPPIPALSICAFYTISESQDASSEQAKVTART